MRRAGSWSCWLENISDANSELLAYCLRGAHWPEELVDEIVRNEDLQPAFFRSVVETLSDLFDPRLCEVYADLMSEIIGKTMPDELHSPHLAARYRRVRRPRKLDRDPDSIQSVYVMSRVTLGADVAVTSVVLDAAKRCFPNAVVYFVGAAKSWELFAADSRLMHVPVQYGRRGAIRDRLAVWLELRDPLCRGECIVIDPDSRLTQLGLLPICREQDYYFLESRCYRPGSSDALPVLTRAWASENFGAVDAKPYIQTGLNAREFAATVSFGVGDNPSKRVEGRFEADLLKRLPRPLLVDRGAGGDEAERVERAVRASGGDAEMWNGSFAGFAAHIARSGMYVGYDSAGGHVAAACGVPMLSIFKGFPCERFFERWRPAGSGPIRIVRVEPGADPWPGVAAAVDELTRH